MDRSTDERAVQPERTGLAWVRTLVAIAGTWGLVAVHFAQRGWIGATIASAALAGLILVVAGHIARARIRRAQAAMTGIRTVPEPVRMLCVSLLAVAAAVAALTATHI